MVLQGTLNIRVPEGRIGREKEKEEREIWCNREYRAGLCDLSPMDIW